MVIKYAFSKNLQPRNWTDGMFENRDRLAGEYLNSFHVPQEQWSWIFNETMARVIDYKIARIDPRRRVTWPYMFDKKSPFYSTYGVVAFFVVLPLASLTLVLCLFVCGVVRYAYNVHRRQQNEDVKFAKDATQKKKRIAAVMEQQYERPRNYRPMRHTFNLFCIELFFETEHLVEIPYYENESSKILITVDPPSSEHTFDHLEPLTARLARSHSVQLASRYRQASLTEYFNSCYPHPDERRLTWKDLLCVGRRRRSSAFFRRRDEAIELPLISARSDTTHTTLVSRPSISCSEMDEIARSVSCTERLSPYYLAASPTFHTPLPAYRTLPTRVTVENEELAHLQPQRLPGYREEFRQENAAFCGESDEPSCSFDSATRHDNS